MIHRQQQRLMSTARPHRLRVGRPTVVDPNDLDYACHLRDSGHTIAQIVAKTGITRSSLYRHLPPRPPDSVTADGGPPQVRAIKRG